MTTRLLSLKKRARKLGLTLTHKSINGTYYLYGVPKGKGKYTSMDDITKTLQLKERQHKRKTPKKR